MLSTPVINLQGPRAAAVTIDLLRTNLLRCGLEVAPSGLSVLPMLASFSVNKPCKFARLAATGQKANVHEVHACAILSPA